MENTMFKNTFKLLLNNFSLVWKVLLYKLIVIFCVGGLTTIIALPIIKALIENNFFVDFQNLFENMMLNFNLTSLISILISIFDSAVSIIVANNFVLLSIVACSVAVVLYYVLDRLCYLAIVGEIHSFMSSNLKMGFMNCYVQNFGKSFKLVLVKLISSFILNAGIIAGAFFIFSALKTSLFAPYVALLFAIVLFSLKLTTFVGIESSIISNNASIKVAIKNNMKVLGNKFASILSNSLFIVVFVLILNALSIFFTFGLTLLLTLPLSVVLILIFKNVAYFETMGMRYYSDSDTINMPKKLEEQDKFNRVKDII